MRRSWALWGWLLVGLCCEGALDKVKEGMDGQSREGVRFVLEIPV